VLTEIFQLNYIDNSKLSYYKMRKPLTDSALVITFLQENN